MTPPILLHREPLESREPIVSFAVIRALIAAAALVALVILGFPYDGSAAIALGLAVLPWSLLVLAVTRRNPAAGLSGYIVVGDMVALGLLQAVEPELYVPAHFTALFLVAAHAHFQGTERSVPVGLLAPAILIPITLATELPVRDALAHTYEAMFAVSCLATAVVVGALRSAESSGRLRARALSRRTIDAESKGRRELARSIHDGPLQELSSAEMMLASAEHAIERGKPAESRAAVTEARALIRANVGFLRDEIVELGPYAFDELSLEQALADCLPVWRRRYGFAVRTDIDDHQLDPVVAGALFRITQEAVTNAGKHADASAVTVRLARQQGSVVLEVEDDGRGFGDVDPLGAAETGHIGLASMRERAEMLGGELALGDVDGGGASVRVKIPV